MVMQRPIVCEWVSRGAKAPDPPERINGCSEGEISLTSGQPVIRLDGVTGSMPGHTMCQRDATGERQRLPSVTVTVTETN